MHSWRQSIIKLSNLAKVVGQFLFLKFFEVRHCLHGFRVCSYSVATFYYYISSVNTIKSMLVAQT